jgi:hypothetical protein
MTTDEGDLIAVVTVTRADRGVQAWKAAAVADRLEKELRELLADRQRRPPALADPRGQRRAGVEGIAPCGRSVIVAASPPRRVMVAADEQAARVGEQSAVV